MGLLNSLIKTVVDVATTPVDIVRDVVTLGGTLTNEDSAILDKAEKLADDLNEVADNLP